jgi:3'-phosphoadenosine 5'-phosphosulfate (PAPS) 3'-phosphatase
MNTSGEEDMLRLLAAAKAAVRAACRVTATVQSSSLSHIAKSDSSPVTVADFAAQAIVTIVLRHQLALPLDSPFLMMGEEDEATFRGAGPEVMARVAQLVEVTIPKAAFLASAEVATDSSAQATWSVEDVAAAISMGGYAGYKAGSSSFWVLDPVDGTKGFLRRGQYAVGLAYVIRGTVSLAVIGCPNLPFPALIDGHVPGSKPAPGSVAIQFASQNVQSSPPSHADAVALRLLQLRKHGLVFPYVCSGCTTLNESYPSVCQFDECGTPNQT